MNQYRGFGSTFHVLVLEVGSPDFAARPALFLANDACCAVTMKHPCKHGDDLEKR